MDFSLPPIVLFDMDGVQVLSEHVHEQRWIALASSLDVRMTKEDFDRNHRFPIPDEQGGWREVNRPLRGAHEDVICHWILHKRKQKGHKTSPSLKEMRIRLFDLYKAKSENLVPRRNLPELIHDIADRGFLLGTVTGCHRGIAEINMKALNGASTLMSFIITADDTTKHKPDPSPYYLALEKAQDLLRDPLGRRPMVPLSVLAKQTVIIEDSPSGVRAALSVSGARCIQYLLPGQKPFKDAPAASIRGRLFKARHDIAIKRHISHIYRGHPVLLTR